MPGMHLTAMQVQRLSGVDISVCRLVLDDLVRAPAFFTWGTTVAIQGLLKSMFART